MASVLVVDDEEDIRELVRINLELDGHRVITAPDGRAALDHVRAHLPDVVVLDVMMPGMDGWGVLAEMKSERPEVASIPVLMLTARTDNLDRLRGGIEGAIRYLTKPFALDELRAEVRKALEGEPEPVKRRRAQHDALEELARLERGGPPVRASRGPRPRLTKLEGAPEPKSPTVRIPRLPQGAADIRSAKQRELLHAVAATPTVREAAARLSVSRSNVYASLRRIARKLDVKSVPELVALARQGGFPTADD
jgi:CheY-like chemotaxis protein/DNA-binding CsgD family transcriptional regulator